MEKIFLNVVQLSISASWIILITVLLRQLLSKAPKWMRGILWAMVAIRLIVPVSIESAISLVPPSPLIPHKAIITEVPELQQPEAFVNRLPILPQPVPQFSKTAGWQQSLLEIAALVWIIGIAVMLIYAIISLTLLRKKVQASIHIQDQFWICDNISSSFIVGVFSPRIYLPSDLNTAEQAAIIRHEQAHLQRHDHWWKALGFFLLSVHWFNPLCWLAYALFCRDIELACDEKAIASMDRSEVISYAETLLNCSIPRQNRLAGPLAFGEIGVRQRIKSILRYKKPKVWIVLLTALICLASGLCFMTQPKKYQQTIRVSGQNYIRSEGIILGTLPQGCVGIGVLASTAHHTDEIPEEDFTATNLDEKYPGNAIYQCAEIPSTIYLQDPRQGYIPFQADQQWVSGLTFDTLNPGQEITSAQKLVLLADSKTLRFHIDAAPATNELELGLRATDGSEYIAHVRDAMKDADAVIQNIPSGIYTIFVRNYSDSRLQGAISLMLDIAAYFTNAYGWVSMWGDFLMKDFPGELHRQYFNLPNSELVWNENQVLLKSQNAAAKIFQAKKIANVFFADLTGDTFPEICATLLHQERGIEDYRVAVYDGQTGKYYEKQSAGRSDYVLKMEDGLLKIYRYPYPADLKKVPEESGLLVLSNGELVLYHGVTVTYQTDGGIRSCPLNWYESGQFNFDYDSLVPLSTYQSGKLLITVADTEQITVGLDYYESLTNGVQIRKETQELFSTGRNQFELPIKHLHPDKEEKAVFYLPYQDGKYVLQINFLPLPSGDTIR